jgi:hypothetical protein
MAKQRIENKNCDNYRTNILQYIDVYKRIQNGEKRIVGIASEQPRFFGFISSTKVSRENQEKGERSAKF